MIQSLPHIEGLELKRTMSTLVGFETIEFQTLQASEKQKINKLTSYLEKIVFGVNSL